MRTDFPPVDRHAESSKNTITVVVEKMISNVYHIYSEDLCAARYSSL